MDQKRMSNSRSGYRMTSCRLFKFWGMCHFLEHFLTFFCRKTGQNPSNFAMPCLFFCFVDILMSFTSMPVIVECKIVLCRYICWLISNFVTGNVNMWCHKNSIFFLLNIIRFGCSRLIHLLRKVIEYQESAKWIA